MERNRRHQKSNMTFSQYCERIEEILRLVGRKIKPRTLPQPQFFKLYLYRNKNNSLELKENPKLFFLDSGLL